MAPLGRSTAMWISALFACMLMLPTAVSSATAGDGEELVGESFAEVIQADIWVLNDSLKALVEPVQSSTVLVSMEDGTVQAWRKKSDIALWSFSSGPPLTSFRMFSKNFEKEVDDDGEEEWDDEESKIYMQDDGSLYVLNGATLKKMLKITVDDLRHGIVLVRNGEIIQVDRHITIFLVDLDTGTITQELWNGNTEELNVDRERKSLFLIRTDYTATASSVAGASLWSLSYGEVGTLVTGLETSTQEMASLSLLPRMTAPQPGVPYTIARPMIRPATIVGLSRSVTKSLPPAQNRGVEHLALPVRPAPASLPLPKPGPALVIWEQDDGSGMPRIHAPPHLSSPKPTPKIIAVYTIVTGLLIIAIFGVVIRISVTTKVSPMPVPKRRKTRKMSPVEKEPVTVAAEESNGSSNDSRGKLQLKYGSGTHVGRLFVSNVLIGTGSNGTLVLEGYLDDRKVAVKRLLAQYYEKAQKEIALLIASDEHPNVVRYYATEETADFVYVSLERCSFSLYDLILAQTSQGAGMEKQVKECLAGKGLKLRSVEDFMLWDEKGRPSPQLFQVMRDIVAGLAHLHAVGIVHRDLKPHNVLISSGRIMQAKIADMGLSKQLDDDAVSFDTQLTGHGSSGSRGWQAPEQLLKRRGSRAVDVFSLGCVLYHCITGGKHPFGSHLERDGNIAYGKMDLFHIVDFPEASDLIESLLDPNPVKRPPAQDILVHPFFWDAEKRMAFLKDVSDRVELDIKDCNSILLADIEGLELSVLCGGWDAKFDFALLQNIRGYRRYNFKSVRDLLRVIRNKANHFIELPEQLQASLGPIPEGIDAYFSSRFPLLLIEIYHVIGYHCRADSSFEKYYTVSYVPKFPRQEKS